RNYPYQGRSDGFTTELRKKFSAADYLGIEIEVRNSLRPTSAAWQKLGAMLASLTRDYCAANG
ncbi:MAG: N-formylglutamate amidohydrolase, partial [Planctomycetota bacterium]